MNNNPLPPSPSPTAPTENGLASRMFIDNVSQPMSLPPIWLFEKGYQPKLSIQECMKHLEVLRHDQMMSFCSSRCKTLVEKPPESIVSLDLIFEDILAVLIYTYDLGVGYREQCPYFRLNKILRERNEAELLRWKDYIFYLMRALNKLPNSGPKRVYRGIDFKVDSEKYGGGNHISWNAFTSTSVKREVAEKFLQKKDGTIFIIDIHPFAGKAVHNISYFPGEDEILLEPNSEFEVAFSDDLGSRLIYLKQLPTTLPIFGDPVLPPLPPCIPTPAPAPTPAPVTTPVPYQPPSLGLGSTPNPYRSAPFHSPPFATPLSPFEEGLRVLKALFFQTLYKTTPLSSSSPTLASSIDEFLVRFPSTPVPFDSDFTKAVFKSIYDVSLVRTCPQLLSLLRVVLYRNDTTRALFNQHAEHHLCKIREYFTNLTDLHNADVQSHTLSALWGIVYNDTSNQLLVLKLRLLECLKVTMSSHPSSVGVQRNSLAVVKYLGSEPNSKQAIGQLGLIPFVKSAMICTSHDPASQRLGCEAIWNLTLDSTVNREICAGAIILEAIALTIKNHLSGSGELMTAICGAVSAVCYQSPSNKEIAQRLGLRELIGNILKTHSTHGPTQIEGVKALNNVR